MKIDQMLKELTEIAKRIGIKTRTEPGSFKSGYCILDEQKLIIFNRSTTTETKAAVLARILFTQDIEGIYIKPVVREFIEKEEDNIVDGGIFELEIDYEPDSEEDNPARKK